MQVDLFNRREFIALAGGAALIRPFAVLAQQPSRIGILLTVAESDPATRRYLASFRRRLRELGWDTGRNIRFETRWAGGDHERMRVNIEEIVGLSPNVILAQNTPTVAALRKQTVTIPIVFVQVSDPVGDGFVKALARPDSNATGFTNTMASLGGKWAELLKEAAPRVSRMGFVYNKAAAPGGGAYYLEPFQAAAAALGLQSVPVELHNVDEIDTAIATFVTAGGDGMVANSDSFITVNSDRIIAAANNLCLPTIYSSADRTSRGGLMSYGADTEQEWLGAASYVSRILRGEKPDDLPVQQPARFILSINLNTAKKIGLDIPWFLQQRADEVIE